MEKKFLSVSEFAKQIGMSRQAVYKKIKNNQLSTCVNEIDNQIFIDIEAFRKISVNQTDNQVDMDCNQVDNQVDSKSELIEILKKELEEKNRQLEEKDNQIRMFQKLLDQEQQLRLINNTETKLIEESSEETETQLTFFSKIKKYFIG